MDSEEVLIEGSSVAGAIKRLLLNMSTVRRSLVECGYKKIIINTSKTIIVVETTDGKERIVPVFDDHDDTSKNTMVVETIDGKKSLIIPVLDHDDHDDQEHREHVQQQAEGLVLAAQRIEHRPRLGRPR